MGVRKNYRSLSDVERDRLVAALLHVKSTGLVDQFATLHAAHFNHGIHRSSHFLPWHREFILRFERELQKHHPDITLPYWDSSVDRSPSDPVWQEAFLGRFNGAWGLGRALGSDTLPTPEEVTANRLHDRYDVFWPRLETDIHNPPHRWVGGVMAGAASPGDPIFFLHHCWIDLLWVQWQRAHPGAPFVASGAGLGFGDPLMEWPDRTPAAVQDHHALGYSYDVEVEVWHHNTPSGGHLAVAPGTSPTSWYTTPENVQHIAYVGTDQQIQECFYFIGGENRWFHNTPSGGHVAVAPGTSPTSWYTTPENVQHIAYVGTDQQIHECFYFIGGDGGWFHNVPSTGHVPVAPGTSPTSWYTTPENVQHIAYVGTDQQIHECFYFIGGDGGWFHNVPSTGHVPVAPGTSPTSWYTTPENVQHIAYVGTDQQIHECFYFIGGDGGWFHNVPSTGHVPVAPGTSPTSWYTTPENVQHIAYVGTDQQIHECFYFIGGDGGWFHNVPSTGHVPVAPGTSPTSWYTTPENVQHIAYVGVDQQIHECFYFIGGENRWFHNVPSGGHVPVAPGTSPTSWYTTPENVQHIAYVGTDQQIQECFYFIR